MNNAVRVANGAGITVPPLFDVDRLEGQSRFARWLVSLIRYPFLQRLLDFVRWVTPVWRVPFLGITVVLRYDHVSEVLARSRQFPVPWGWKMELVTTEPKAAVPGGRNFVLGMREPDLGYRQDYALLAHAFPYAEVVPAVTLLARQASERCLDHWKHQGGRSDFDAVQDLVLAVPAMMCESYYGIRIPDPVYFGKCTLAVSSFLFGPQFEDASGRSARESKQMALEAAAPIRQLIRASMHCASAGTVGTGGGANPLERLMQAVQAKSSPQIGIVDEDRVHVQLFGMVLGFIPTNVLAAGNLLETLLAYPEFMALTAEAARAGDDERLWRCLREVLRFRNINLGPLRLCAESCEIANPRGGSTRFRQGEKILACTQSAMFDRRRITHPHLFDSHRPDEDYLVFGLGQHWCIGAYIAIAQITQMFKLLLTRYDVAAVPGTEGRMKRFNVFPLHLMVRLSPR